MRIERVALPLLLVLFISKLTLAMSADRAQRLLRGEEEEPFRSNLNPSNGRNNMGIPFRPVRRIGSEFLGKRSERAYEDPADDFSEDKRALGSEFLGKRRLGSEFLGKRGGDDSSWDGDNQWSGPLNSHEALLEKRAVPSAFVGRRRQGPWEWSWKRGLGSEFLGKRVLGSEFLGKRSTAGHDEDWSRPFEVVARQGHA